MCALAGLGDTRGAARLRARPREPPAGDANPGPGSVQGQESPGRKQARPAKGWGRPGGRAQGRRVQPEAELPPGAVHAVWRRREEGHSPKTSVPRPTLGRSPARDRAGCRPAVPSLSTKDRPLSPEVPIRNEPGEGEGPAGQWVEAGRGPGLPWPACHPHPRLAGFKGSRLPTSAHSGGAVGTGRLQEVWGGGTSWAQSWPSVQRPGASGKGRTSLRQRHRLPRTTCWESWSCAKPCRRGMPCRCGVPQPLGHAHT